MSLFAAVLVMSVGAVRLERNDVMSPAVLAEVEQALDQAKLLEEQLKMLVQVESQVLPPQNEPVQTNGLSKEQNDWYMGELAKSQGHAKDVAAAMMGIMA